MKETKQNKKVCEDCGKSETQLGVKHYFRGASTGNCWCSTCYYKKHRQTKPTKAIKRTISGNTSKIPVACSSSVIPEVFIFIEELNPVSILKAEPVAKNKVDIVP